MPPNSASSTAAATASSSAAFSASLSPTSPALTSISTFVSAPTMAIDAAPEQVVRLFSIQQAPPKSKILHLIRHAEGTHNISPDSHKMPLHWDARLTEKGIKQCQSLAKATRYHYERQGGASLDSTLTALDEQVERISAHSIHPSVGEVEAVIVSPMSRCLQTATLSFPHYCRNDLGGSSSSSSVSIIAHESWRETTNFLCDSRRPLSQLQNEFPCVDFDMISHEDDPIWLKYESIYGSHDEFDGLRESKDGRHLARRVREAWTWLASRPERNLAICSHSAFFMHQFQPYLPEMMGLISYEDKEVERLMMDRRFDNCELRTVAFQTAEMAGGGL